jgi:hypothetical protein
LPIFQIEQAGNQENRDQKTPLPLPFVQELPEHLFAFKRDWSTGSNRPGVGRLTFAKSLGIRIYSLLPPSFRRTKIERGTKALASAGCALRLT